MARLMVRAIEEGDLSAEELAEVRALLEKACEKRQRKDP